MATHEQFSFGGGLNAARAADKLAEGEVAAAVNIDFGREEGAAALRRGTHRRWSLSGEVRRIFRNYNNPYDYGASPYYFATSNGIYRSIGGVTTQIRPTGAQHPAFGSWREWTLIANGNEYWADNGTSLREWVGQAPGAPPQAAAQWLPPLNLAQGGWTVVQGTLVEETGGVITIEAADRQVVVDVVAVPQSGNLTTNAGEPIGDFGIHYLDLMLSDPGVVTLITQDYSPGSADFSQGSLHAELRPGDSAEMMGWSEAVVETLPDESGEAREEAIDALRRNLRAPRSMFPTMANVWSVWAVARPQFELTNRSATPAGWSNIGRIRITIQANDAFTVKLRNFHVAGAATYPLNDPVTGYTWWETWAEQDASGNIIRESAPSPASAPLRIQGGQASLTLSTAPSGTYHGYTHRCIYRQGGLMRDAHRVAVVPLAQTAVVDAMSDVDAVFEPVLERDIHSRATFPGNVTAISEPYMGRIFMAHRNIVMWSEPNRPDVFRKDAWTMVSHSGDEVQALIVWGNSLFVINRDSVYELTGTDFSADGDWRLYRTPCRYGTLSRYVPVRTPYGIPLMTNDGLIFYQPGSGGEARLPWVDGRIGPAWSYVPNDRLAQHRPGTGGRTWAAWTSNRLYLAIEPSYYVYVIDFLHETVYYYNYPFLTMCGFYDLEGMLLAGTPAGSVMELETTTTLDATDAGQWVAITGQLRTRTWTWAAPSRLMNISADCRGTVSITAMEAGGTLVKIADVSGAARHRTTPTMSGVEGDALYFDVTLQDGGVLYGIEWDRYEEPLTTLYVRTPYATAKTEMHYQLAKLTVDTFGGDVNVQLFVDGEEALTTTVAHAGNGPATIPLTLSARGWTAYAILHASAPFRFYDLEWDGTPEPPRVSQYETPLEDFGGEVELKTLETTLDCLGNTVTAELLIDSQPIATYTFTGDGVKGYAAAAPLVAYGGAFNHPFGRTAQVRYTAASGTFKHYKTWYGVVREPSRVRHWRTETQWWADDQEVQALEWSAEGFGQTLTIDVYVDSVKRATFQVTAQGHVGGTLAMPSTLIGRSAHAIVTAAAPFKPYAFTWRTRTVPPRVTRWRTEDKVWPSPARLRTVAAAIDPMGGTVTAAVIVNGQTVHTETLASPSLKTFQLGLDLDVAEGTAAYVLYTATTPFRHYATEWHDEPQPFEKTNWGYSFARPLGTAQLLRAVRWSARIYAAAPTPADLTWYDIDGTAVHTVRLLLAAGENRELWQYFPPGVRFMELRMDIDSNGVPIRVHNVDIDVEVTGLRNVYRTTMKGVPSAGQ